jgi:hypothetical protein
MGDCVAACRNIYPNLQALDVAKSLAIRRTLVFAHEESMTNIIIALIAYPWCNRHIHPILISSAVLR